MFLNKKLRKANRMINSGNIDAAFNYLQLFLEKHPQHRSKALYLLSLCVKNYRDKYYYLSKIEKIGNFPEAFHDLQLVKKSIMIEEKEKKIREAQERVNSIYLKYKDNQEIQVIIDNFINLIPQSIFLGSVLSSGVNCILCFQVN